MKFFSLVCVSASRQFLVDGHRRPSPPIRLVLESSQFGNETRIRHRSETADRTNQSPHASLGLAGFITFSSQLEINLLPYHFKELKKSFCLL
jgi:hypothetical protein